MLSISRLEPEYHPSFTFASPPFFLLMASVKTTDAANLAFVVTLLFAVEFLRMETIVVSPASGPIPVRKHFLTTSYSRLSSRRRIVESPVKFRGCSESMISPLSTDSWSSTSTCAAIIVEEGREREREYFLGNGETWLVKEACFNGGYSYR